MLAAVGELDALSALIGALEDIVGSASPQALFSSAAGGSPFVRAADSSTSSFLSPPPAFTGRRSDRKRKYTMDSVDALPMLDQAAALYHRTEKPVSQLSRAGLTGRRPAHGDAHSPRALIKKDLFVAARDLGAAKQKRALVSLKICSLAGVEAYFSRLAPAVLFNRDLFAFLFSIV